MVITPKVKFYHLKQVKHDKIIFFYKQNIMLQIIIMFGLPDLEPDDHPDYGSLVLNILCSDSTRFQRIISLR